MFKNKPAFFLFALVLSTLAFAGTPEENEQFIARQLGDRYVSAQEWGMEPPRLENGYEKDPVKNIIVLRSTGSLNDVGREGMLSFQARELARQGFCAVGPHYVIDAEGFVYGCRGLEYKPAVSVPNTGVIGVTVMGHFHASDAQELTDKAENSLKHLLAALSMAYDIPLDEQHVIAVSVRNAAAAPYLSDMPGRVVLEKLHIIRMNAQKFKEEL